MGHAGWGGSCHVGVGWVMQEWGGDGSCRGGVGDRGVVGDVGMGWVI